MVDTENLFTASSYINNQLLSRGLLRDGHDIDFANLGRGNGDSAETLGRIISLVNDLLLRRDHDARQRESLSTAMRNLRAENSKHASDIGRLSESCTEAQRKLDLATSSEASIKTQLKSAESAMRGLKDEVARMKSLVKQTRETCTLEVRRRDRQIDKLKKQVGEAGRARGAKANAAVMTITVAGGVGGEKKTPTDRSDNTTAEDHSLRCESNSVLAKLVQGLSEENEALLRMMQQTIDQLREMSGWSSGEKDVQVIKQPSWEELASELEAVIDHMRTILTNPSFVPIEEVMVREEEISRLKAGWLKMESRWEDAVHLIDSWRKRMAISGKPVCDEELKMGLRLSPVRVTDVDETRDGRDLGLPVVTDEGGDDDDRMQSPCPAKGSRQVMTAEADHEEDVDEESEGESSGYDEGIPVHDYVAEELHDQVPEPSPPMVGYVAEASIESSPLPEPPQLSPLRNSASAGNRRLENAKPRQKPRDVTAIVEENTRDLAESAAPARPSRSYTMLVAQQLRPATTKTGFKTEERERSVSHTSLDEALLPNGGKGASEDAERSQPKPSRLRDHIKSHSENERPGGLRQTPRRMPPRLGRPRNGDQPSQQSPLTMSTIAAKLAASEREADAARVRAKLRAARSSGGVQRPVIAPAPEPSSRSKAVNEPESEPVVVARHQEDVDPVKRDPVLPPKDEQQQQDPGKRKRTRRGATKASSRRRSTLNPLELQTLISGNVQ